MQSRSFLYSLFSAFKVSYFLSCLAHSTKYCKLAITTKVIFRILDWWGEIEIKVNMSPRIGPVSLASEGDHSLWGGVTEQ